MKNFTLSFSLAEKETKKQADLIAHTQGYHPHPLNRQAAATLYNVFLDVDSMTLETSSNGNQLLVNRTTRADWLVSGCGGFGLSRAINQPSIFCFFFLRMKKRRENPS